MNELHQYHHQRPIHLIGVYICLMGLLSVLYSATLHAVPLSIDQSVFSLLHFTQSNLDNLHSDYQYYLIASLLLSGLVVDIVGPRTVLVIAIMISIAANQLFIQTNSNAILLNCRFLINFSHIFIIIAAMTLGSHWLPRRHFSLYVGLLICILLITQGLLFPCLHKIATREALLNVFWIINLFGFLVAVAIVLTKHFSDKTRYLHTLKGLFEPLSYYKVWLLALVAAIGTICNTITLAFGTYYVIKKFTIDPVSGYDIIKGASICFAVGAIFMGDFIRHFR